MITADTKPVVDSIRAAQADIKKRLEMLVANFAANAAELASSNTPVVNQENIGPEGRMRKLYEARLKRWDIPIEIGFHAGSWKYREDIGLILDPNIYAEEEVEGQVRADAKSRYQLGDTFYIQAVGPAMQKLDQGYSPQAPMGIMQPTLEGIMSTFGINIVGLYKKGK